MEIVVNREARLALFGFVGGRSGEVPVLADLDKGSKTKLKEYRGYSPFDISRDGRYLVLGSPVTSKNRTRTTLVVYDRERERPAYEGTGHLFGDARFDATGTRLIIQTLKKTFVLDWATGRTLGEWKEDLFLSKGTMDYRANRLYLPVDNGKRVLLYDVTTGARREVAMEGGKVTQMVYLDKLDRLILSTKDNRLICYDRELETPLWQQDCGAFRGGKSRIWPCPLHVTEDNAQVCVLESGGKGYGYVLSTADGSLVDRLVFKKDARRIACAWFGDEMLLHNKKLLNLATGKRYRLKLPT